MGVEIEKKYLLKNSTWKKHVNKQTRIKQGYLNATPESTVRVRIKGDKGFVTIKGKRINLLRKEFEYEIPLQDAEELLLLCQKPIIEKVRYEVDYQGYTWEIDEFENENEGLMLAEVEMQNEDETPETPEWVGEEVTDDFRYYNSNLMKNPFKTWG